MRLYALDAWVADPAILIDKTELSTILRAGADSALTGVLLLAQSHLSIHTWPELLLANVDLLTYGDVDGDLALRVVSERLGATRTSVSIVARGRR
jgi:S-adenosylmethionine/arginine decarboxylase-like enzyme